MKSRAYWILLRSAPLLLLPLMSCNPNPLGDCSGGKDSDGDGLNNDVECNLGTDPNIADSDGDGISDGAEVAAGTDPTRNEVLQPKVPGCVGECVVNYNCPVAQGPTTISGTVYIPSGALPLYNAKVYIPTGAAIEPPPTTGASCDRCDTTPQGFSTVTDINGNFTLTNVPHGQNIPLIIRVGKWRRVITIPSISQCSTTALAATETRLPRNQSEGSIPKIALTTGSADALECILRRNKLGLDDSEFTTESGNGRVNLYLGGPDGNGNPGANRFKAGFNGQPTAQNFTAANPWWNTGANLNKYDIVLFSCEGTRNTAEKNMNAHAALQNYINAGGRVFASHWHNIWISGATNEIQSVGTFVTSGGYQNDTTTITADINQNFPKGQALASWLLLPAVNGSTQSGKLDIKFSRQTLTSRDATKTQDWVNFQPPGYTRQSQYFSFNAPLNSPAESQCGQMVFTDIHVSGDPNGDTSSANTPFPDGCRTSGLTPQEKALIFMLFDLTNCLSPPIG
jgi:hypothetical protein